MYINILITRLEISSLVERIYHMVTNQSKYLIPKRSKFQRKCHSDNTSDYETA